MIIILAGTRIVYFIHKMVDNKSIIFISQIAMQSLFPALKVPFKSCKTISYNKLYFSTRAVYEFTYICQKTK